ncbi:Threonine/homoserine efflux transporter RhtA [bacterium A37T11]|nr:Threonine/homoserine efflux transporter RhtA [bacterium A37T11]
MAGFTPNKNMLLLHLTVLVWGFTGILGALISISAMHLVWYRVLIAALSLFLYFQISGRDLRVNKSDLFRFLMTGGLVGLHWFLFFQSIKVATVSVTLVCMSSITLFTSVLEPLFYRRKIDSADVITGIFIIAGIYLIFTFETQYVLGIVLGLLCAICASIFSIINSKLVKSTQATVISFYEMVGAWGWISLYMLVSGGFNAGMKLNQADLIYLLLLGTICTSVAYAAGILVMKKLSAFTVALVTNLEPVYGILLALIIFNKSEKMSSGFYLGALIVLAAVFGYPFIKSGLKNRSKIQPSKIS